MKEINKVLLVASRVPDDPDALLEIDRVSLNMGERQFYNFELYRILRGLVPEVAVARDPTEIPSVGVGADYAVSVYSSERLSSEEVVVAAHCEAMGIPMLCGDALTLARVEDKHTCKLAAIRRGLPTAKWIAASPNDSTIDWASVRFPCVVKPRFGMSFQFIDENAVSQDVDAAKRRVETLFDTRRHALIEAYVPGHDITVACVGEDGAARIGMPIQVLSDAPGGVQTRRQKMEDGIGRRRLDMGEREVIDSLRKYCGALYEEFFPMDFFRADFRYDPETRSLAFLELNKPAINMGSNFARSCSTGPSAYRDLITDLIRRGAKRHGLTLPEGGNGG